MCNTERARKQVLKRMLLSACSILVFSFGYTQPDGEQIFKNNCAVCHKIDGKLTGPALRGVTERAPSQEWILKWIKNSQKLVEEGDEYALKIFTENNKIIMPPQSLSDEEILALIDYINNVPVETTAEVARSNSPVDEKNGDHNNNTVWLIGFLVTLIIISLVLRSVRNKLKLLIAEKQELKPTHPKSLWESSLWWIATHKKHTAFIIIVLMVASSVKAWYVLKNIGVYQDYAPEQPIKFSHKIHAGDNKINCVYCHSGAEKGRVAGIPSVNVCMNCHRGISSGRLYGTKEINKIYQAAGWNPETQQYDKEAKAIKWVRVHNLPDFSYFNHSQHVVVGKQICQTCHGPVQTMDVMKQFAPLTMGWCVNCHRTTAVDINNAYYNKIHKQLLEKNKNNKNKFFVNDIGGLECSKCHY